MKSYDRFGIELGPIAELGDGDNPSSGVSDPPTPGLDTDNFSSEDLAMNISAERDSQHNYNGGLDNGTIPSKDGENPEMEKSLLYATNFLEYDPDQHELEEELGFIDPSNPPVQGWNLRYLQWKTRRVVEHFSVRLLTSLFIIIDTIVLIIDLINGSTAADDPLEYCALVFSVYFLIEVAFRIFGLGCLHYFIKWYNVLDFVIVIVTFILSVLMVQIEKMSSHPANLLVILRLIRLFRITRLFWQRRHIAVGARQFISQNKRRFQKDGFDLDLTYVTPTIIAMSFPSTGRMSLYRNDIKEVARFFNTKHKNHYRLYNLCSEREYDTRRFYGNVKRYLIDDHNVPSLEEMLQFSEDVRSWMTDDDQNVIGVHCKGGKGRTGTMICVVLIDMDIFNDSIHCLGYFGDRRTDKKAGKKFQGVETPSQSRYVGYYERIVKMGREIPEEIPLVVTGFTLRGIQSVGEGDGSDFSLTIRSRFHVVAYEASLHAGKNCKVIKRLDKDEVHVELYNAPVVKGDTKVMFHSPNKKIPKGYENCPFFFWFHTGFIDKNRLELYRHELDNPHKPKTWNVFGENFTVITHFIHDRLSTFCV